jgi:hypothetical protein
VVVGAADQGLCPGVDWNFIFTTVTALTCVNAHTEAPCYASYDPVMIMCGGNVTIFSDGVMGDTTDIPLLHRAPRRTLLQWMVHTTCASASLLVRSDKHVRA